MRAVDFNSARTFATARWVAPVLFGIWSLSRGADANWDLLNYHLYNAFALLHGKLSVDLAPAGLQTYFNPLLDIPYYVLNLYLFAPIVGFVFGAAHGLNFVLLAEIARMTLDRLPAEDRYRIPLLIAIAGCLTPGFVSELGNTMGDNATALLVLSSLLLIVRAWPRLFGSSGRASVMIAMGAGALAGLAVGLKLTNGPYAVALCLAFLAVPASWSTRLRLATCFAIGAVAAVATAGGWWFVEMWRRFQNPLFPQFTTLFPNPLAAPASMLDSGWGPKGWTEALLWPFVFALDSYRVGQTVVRQVVWPVVYTLFWISLVAAVMRVRGKGGLRSLDGRSRFLVAFVAVGFLLWMLLFSISRYLVPIELLAPLVIFVLLASLFRYRSARRIWVASMGLATALVVAGGYETWGHRGWADPPFSADVPSIPDPGSTTVLIASEAQPLAWLATQFPDRLSFVHLSPFPTGPAYAGRVGEILTERGGSAFALMRGHWDERRQRVADEHALLTTIGATTTDTGCQVLSWIAGHSRTRKSVRFLDEARIPTYGSRDVRCEVVLRPGEERDIDAEDRKERETGEAVLARYGLTLVPGTCNSYKARIGRAVEMYQWCEVRERGP